MEFSPKRNEVYCDNVCLKMKNSMTSEVREIEVSTKKRMFMISCQFCNTEERRKTAVEKITCVNCHKLFSIVNSKRKQNGEKYLKRSKENYDSMLK